MKNVLIIHGCVDRDEYYNGKYPSPSNLHWLPWLQNELLMHDIAAQTPEMPSPPQVYEEWKRVFEQFEVGKDTILVGHSCGAGFLLRWLSENPRTVAKLMLVAPYLDPEKKRGDYLDFTIDPELSMRVGEIHVFNSSDDTESIHTSVDEIMGALPKARLHSFTNKGHFIYKHMKTTVFPEIRDIILSSDY